MESKMKCKVVMLATNKIQANGIQIIKNTGRLRLPITGAELRRIVNNNTNWKPQHLYLISNEEIKDGDYCVCVKKFGVLFTDGTEHKFNQLIKVEHEAYYQVNKTDYKKVIATTDTTLNLPLIPQSFIEKYVEVNDKIDEVMVETELIESDKFWFKQFPDSVHDKHYKVKTRKDNTVIISKVKDIWNYDEHCTDMQYYMEYCQSNSYVTPQKWLAELKHY
jgi:hypothetical protein